MDAVRIDQLRLLNQPMPVESVSKWDVLRDLTTGRAAFGLNDRDLSVLQALLSFYPRTQLDDPERMIVHPANASICERLNGMPCSTMRRHLARLIEAGMLIRHDSPNGKRYVRRSQGGETRFGFDLSPLARRIEEICAAAAEAKMREERIAQLREEISLMRRDLLGLLEMKGTDCNALPGAERFADLLALSHRLLRRKLNEAELEDIRTAFQRALSEIRDVVAEDLSSRNIQYEQHYQRSNKEILESESCEEIGKSEVPARSAEPQLNQVLAACPEIQSYSESPVRDWSDLARLAETVRPMMGISCAVWLEAKSKMGIGSASTTLAAILQRFSEIKSPGAYLRVLAVKAASGSFSPEPMLRSLSRRSLEQSSQL